MGWLARYGRAECCDVTTIGRRSGDPHEIEIWFGVIDDVMYLISGNGPRSDWYLNALANPEVGVRLAGESHRATARPVTDADERRAVGDVMGAKYQWDGDASIGLTRDAWCYEVPVLALENWLDGVSDRLRLGADGNVRCWWCGDDPVYVAYHDDEWGRRVTNDTRLFEKLCLEGFQSGLSWLTILRKRQNFRAAFADFDVHAVAAFDEGDVQRLLGDAGIVRHRGKIQSTINNAQRAIELIESEGSLSAYVDRYRPAAPTRLTDTTPLPATTPESVALSKDLKKRGWSFVGPTTVYAFMQAMGLVNDHIEGCWVFDAAGTDEHRSSVTS